jgi:hypothetical protein
MTREPDVIADIALVTMRCHRCEASIQELSVVFMHALRASETVEMTQAHYPICRGCFEYEMARRTEDLRT